MNAMAIAQQHEELASASPEQPVKHTRPVAKHPTKVLILVENLSVPFDRRVWNEARSLQRAGHQVTVICPRMIDKKPHEVLDGVQIYRYPLPLLATNGAWGYLWEYPWAMLMTTLYATHVFARHGFKAIHACNPPDLFFLVGLLFRPFGVRFIYDQHDLCPETYISRFGRSHGVILKVLRLLEKWTYRTADLVIATNESYRQKAIERGKCAQEAVHVVRSAPDVQEFRPEKPDPTLKGGYSNLVCYLGTMAPQDGVDYLIRAAQHVVHDRKRQDIRFALIGGGDSIPDLKRQVAEFGLEEHIHFTGRISDEDLRRWLSTADVCVAPDPVNPLNNVSTMNKILEYMAMEKPIVSFALQETMRSAGDSAVYAIDNDSRDLGDQLVSLIDDVPRQKTMGKLGRERLLQRLSWRRSEEHLIRAYDSLAIGSGQKG